MRNLSQNFIDAMIDTDYKYHAKMRIYKTHGYFDGNLQPASLITSDNHAVTVCNDKVVSVNVTQTGLRINVLGGGTLSRSVSIDRSCKIGAYGKSDGTLYVYYLSGSGVVTCDVFQVSGSSVAYVSTSTYFGSKQYKALFPVMNGTGVVSLFTYGVTVGVAHHTPTGTTERTNGFLFEKFSSSKNPNILWNSAAIETSKEFIIYITSPQDGSVYGISYVRSYGQWTQDFIAVPTDVSVTAGMSEVIIKHGGIDSIGRPYLVGQFRRKSDLDNNYTYTIIMYSQDGGKNFSMETKSILFAQKDTTYSYWFAPTSTACYLVGIGGYYQRNPFYPFSNQYLEITSEQSRIKNGSINTSEISFAIADGEGYTIDQDPEWFKIGNLVELWIGLYTSNSITWEKYASYIINSINKGYASGKREFVINATHEGIWKLETVAQPIYTEIQCKTSSYETFDKEHGLYLAQGGGMARNMFFADFRKANNEIASSFPYSLPNYPRSGVFFGYPQTTYIRINGAHCAFTSINTVNYTEANTYVTATSTTVDVRIRYWSRPFYDGAVGPWWNDTTKENDQVYISLVIEKPDGTESEIAGDVIGYRRTPRTYPNYYDVATRPGSDPVVYRFAVEQGTKIKKVNICFAAPHDTLVYPEHIQITNVSVVYAGLSKNTPWEQSGGKMRVPEWGRPFVMFSMMPSSSKNFAVSAEFSYDSGIEPSQYSVSKIMWGLVGLAKDTNNLFVFRYNKILNRFELVKISGGYEQVLTTATYNILLSSHQMMMRHDNGRFYCYAAYAKDYPYELVIDYAYTDTNELVQWDDLHVGIYGVKITPSFRICSFNMKNSGGYIPMLPGEYTEFSNMPSSGKVIIGNSVYMYSEKISIPESKVRGPFQLRAVYTNKEFKYDYRTSFPWYRTSQYFAVDASMMMWTSPEDKDYIPSYDPENPSKIGTNGHHQFDYQNCILSIQSGSSYKIYNTDWNPHITTNNVGQYLPNRARFFCHYGSADRMCTTDDAVYITCGLGGISTSSEVPAGQYHMEGELCMMYATDEIYCNEFFAVSGDNPSTIKDMLAIVTGRAGVKLDLPGNRNFGTLALSKDDFYEL